MKFGLFIPGKSQAVMPVSKSPNETSHDLRSIHIMQYKAVACYMRSKLVFSGSKYSQWIDRLIQRETENSPGFPHWSILSRSSFLAIGYIGSLRRQEKKWN